MLGLTLAMLFYIKINKPTSVKTEVNQTIAPKEQNEEAEDNYFLVSFLDVGQGDASLIEWPDGRQMLVDCGADDRVLEALGRTMDFYDKQIDYLLVTHPDLDHYGGCIDVLKRFKVNKVIYSGLQKQDGAWQVFWQAVQDEGAEYKQIKEQEEWEIGGAVIKFLYPDHDLNKNNLVPGAQKANDNDSSIVFKLSYGESDILFTGDAEIGLEDYLSAKYGDELDVEVLKVGHHGSGSSSGQSFLDLITPEISTISVGAENKYGHPSLRVIRRLEREESKILRTDLDGDIKIDLDEKKGYTLVDN